MNMLLKINPYELVEINFEKSFTFFVQTVHITKDSYNFSDSNTPDFHIAKIELGCIEGTLDNIGLTHIIQKYLVPIHSEKNNKEVEIIVDFLKSVAQVMQNSMIDALFSKKGFCDLPRILKSEESRLLPNDQTIYAKAYDLAQEMISHSIVYCNFDEKTNKKLLLNHFFELTKID